MTTTTSIVTAFAIRSNTANDFDATDDRSTVADCETSDNLFKISKNDNYLLNEPHNKSNKKSSVKLSPLGGCEKHCKQLSTVKKISKVQEQEATSNAVAAASAASTWWTKRSKFLSTRFRDVAGNSAATNKKDISGSGSPFKNLYCQCKHHM
jgi:hypothetical protein